MAIVWSDRMDDVDWDELSTMYRQALGEKSPELLRTVFGNSMHRCFIREDGRLVGAGRVVGDGADFAYVCDVALLPSHQGAGLGKALVQKLVDLSRGHKKIMLYAVPGKEPFYRKFGFERMTTAMCIFADPEAAFANGYLRAD